MIDSAEEADEFAEWQARHRAARPAGGLYRRFWRIPAFLVGFWLFVFVVLLATGETQAAVPFLGLGLVQGLVLLIVQRYRLGGGPVLSISWLHARTKLLIAINTVAIPRISQIGP